MGIKLGLRSILKFLGKGEKKVVAIFGVSPQRCREAVAHVVNGSHDTRVWLFSPVPPLAETAALCERVTVHSNTLVLLLRAEILLWRHWVALSVATWTGESGGWFLKLAPFMIPPFRVLLMNRCGDFFSGTPANVLVHFGRGCRDIACSSRQRVLDVVNANWRLVSFHLWRSGPVRRARDLLRGSLLFVAATVVRCIGYPHRGFFHRRQGSGKFSLNIELHTGPVDNLVDRFIPPRSGWSHADFRDFVASSQARWILWQAGDDAGPIDDLLPLFDDQRTFAVGRQVQARAWKPALIPMAPFWKLQPGAASQVLAPISSTLLVERSKLASIGVPEAALAETAWMLIFWKAAAAGLRSYCVGREGPVGQQPDYPVQETEFFFRVMTDEALRGLQPQEPDLASGTIEFVPNIQERTLRSRDRLKVLLVAPFLPYPLSHGGAVRMYNLCRALADRVDFTLVALREASDVVQYDKLHEVFRNVYVVDIDERASEDTRLPRQVRPVQSKSLRALIADLSRTWRPDLLQIEYTHMAAFRPEESTIPALLVEHDLTFSLYRQLAEKQPGRDAWSEYERWLEFERKWLRAYEGVWTVSDDDRRDAIREGSSPERTFAVANGVDVERFIPECGPEYGPEFGRCELREILYVGSFRHLPNIIGYQKLCQEIMPRVWECFPQARVRVVAGPEHERYWREFTGTGLQPDPRIEIQGFVEDLRPFYASATVVAVPLEVSAGTSIKVLEAMACGKPVVTTPVGCAGLGLVDGKEVFIRAGWADFADAVCHLMAGPRLQLQMGGCARRTAETRFSWTVIAERAYESYVTLAASGAAGLSEGEVVEMYQR